MYKETTLCEFRSEALISIWTQSKNRGINAADKTGYRMRTGCVSTHECRKTAVIMKDDVKASSLLECYAMSVFKRSWTFLT
jgi:hypothetical protein